MNKLKLILSTTILALLMSVIFVAPVSGGMIGSKSNDAIKIETDKMIIEVKGGAFNPFFFFYENGQEANETAHYKFQLDQIFESEDLNGDMLFDNETDTVVANSMVALSSLTWEFSEFVIEKDSNDITTAIHFNITSNDDKAYSPVNNTDNFFIQFRMHMDVENTAEIKFDVVIDNYQFKSSTSMLVIGFKLITLEKQNMVRANNSFSFGDAYFESAPKANDSFGETHVGLSNSFDDGENRIYLSYENFDGRMVHDPILGLSSVSNDPIDSELSDNVNDADGSSDQSNGIEIPELSKEEMFVVNLFAILTFLLVPVLIIKAKK